MILAFTLLTILVYCSKSGNRDSYKIMGSLSMSVLPLPVSVTAAELRTRPTFHQLFPDPTAFSLSVL